jgi:hypothetical protein
LPVGGAVVPHGDAELRRRVGPVLLGEGVRANDQGAGTRPEDSEEPHAQG